MLRDERGLALSTDSPEAAQLLDRAVEHFLKYRADVMSVAGRMLAGDPEFVMGHCFKGYMLLGASNPAHRPAIAEAVKAAEAGAAVTTGRERRHVAALAAWAGGQLDTSFAIWREILDADPTDLLALRICDTTRFRHGQTAKVLEQADRVAPGWSPELPGYDCLQCVWAFAHEEAGDTRAPSRSSMRPMRSTPPTTSPTTSRRTCWKWNAGRARVATGWRRKPALAWRQQTDPSLVVAPRADATGARRARRGAGKLRHQHPQPRRADDQGDARPYIDLQNATPCCGGWSSWGSMSATAGRNWPTRPRRGSAMPAICCWCRI